MHPEMKKALREGLLRRVLPTFAILVIALAIVKPDWQALLTGLCIVIPLGLILGVVIRRRIRAAGIETSETGAPVKVALQVRPGLLFLGIAASFAIGAAVGEMEQRFHFDVGGYGVVVFVPLMLFALGLSLKPKRHDDGE